MEKKKWIEQFNENYYGGSQEAKELEKYLKTTFKGNAYIPWAVMERMTYQQDPDAVFEKVTSATGDMVISTHMNIETTIDGKFTSVSSVAHFVIVTLEFLGRKFTESYPIQDKDYSAPKVYDQNMVNKAYQRALAKVASRATGLGLSLYENGELQFDESTDKSDTQKPMPKKTTVEKTREAIKVIEEVTPATPVIEKVVEQQPSGNETVDKIISIIMNDEHEDKVNNILRSLNQSFIKQSGFSISRNDSVKELQEKISKIADPNKFLSALERLIG